MHWEKLQKITWIPGIYISTKKKWKISTTKNQNHEIFADDIAAFFDTLQNATLLLHNIEVAAKEVDILINGKKTWFMSFCLSWIGIAWSAMNEMSQIWESEIPKSTEISFSRASVESILLMDLSAGRLQIHYLKNWMELKPDCRMHITATSPCKW